MTADRHKCPECGVQIKESNYESHMKRVHGVWLDEGARQRDERANKIINIVIVAMLIAVSVFGIYWVALRDEGGGEGPPTYGTTEGEDEDTVPDNGGDVDDGDTPVSSEDPVRVSIAVRDYDSIVIDLYPDRAPITVENFLKYVEDGFFDGLIFHRVIEGFMIQGGGFEPGMTQRPPTYPAIKNEATISQMRNLRGTIAMARTSELDSATSQFYINHVDNPNLDWDEGVYCVFGEVVQGMGVVDAIAAVETTSVGGHNDVPVEDVIISSVRII